MKAIVLHAYGPPSNLKYEDIPDPKPAKGELLIRVHAAGVNPIDWKIRSGATAKMWTTDFPWIPGYDYAGTVQALGEGVTGFAPGDRVFGRTPSCYAELTTASAAEVGKAPEGPDGKPGLDLIVAGALATPVTTADQLIHQAVNAQAGQTILLTGALGSVGHVALFAAIESGVKVIAGVRKSEVEKALALGATAAIDVNDDAALQSLGLIDAVADTIGGPLANKLIAHVKPGGRYGSLVGPPSEAALHPTVTVNAMSSHPDVKAMLHYAEAVRDGKLTFTADLLLPLASAAEAHTRAEKGGAGKIVLTA